jgi:hypothetical protein
MLSDEDLAAMTIEITNPRDANKWYDITHQPFNKQQFRCDLDWRRIK